MKQELLLLLEVQGRVLRGLELVFISGPGPPLLCLHMLCLSACQPVSVNKTGYCHQHHFYDPSFTTTEGGVVIWGCKSKMKPVGLTDMTLSSGHVIGSSLSRGSVCI